MEKIFVRQIPRKAGWKPAIPVLVWLALLAGCAPAPRTEAPAAPARGAAFDAGWAMDPLWDDGQAEVALYTAKRPQYGKIEEYEAVFIVVKEDFDPKLHVKADPAYEGRGLVPVLKFNAVHSYWTDLYPYHFLLSVFVRRDAPATLVKLALGSQEWCGTGFKMVSTRGARPEYVFHSYFDGEGDSSQPLDLRAGDLAEDQLPLALRSLKFAPGLEVRRRILPSLISNRAESAPAFVDAIIRVAGEEEVPAGDVRIPAWKVEVAMGELQQTWWFEKSAPHILVRMESSDGRAWLLKSRTRSKYWQAPTFRPAM